MDKPLSDRAKHRLKIAAGLMRGAGRKKKSLDLSRENFYEGIQALIAELEPDEQATLKEMTDWVEQYDLHSASQESATRAQGAQRGEHRRP